jgi:hypothetical protein
VQYKLKQKKREDSKLRHKNGTEQRRSERNRGKKVARTWKKEESNMHKGIERYQTGRNIRKTKQMEYSSSYSASFYLFRSFLGIDSKVFYAACW